MCLIWRFPFDIFRPSHKKLKQYNLNTSSIGKVIRSSVPSCLQISMAPLNCIGRALVLNPSLLLLDEPLEGLAPIVVQEL